MNNILTILVLLPMAAAIVSYLIGKKNKEARNYFAIAVGIAELVMVLSLWISGDGVLLESELAGWVGFGLHFELDGFRLIYATIVAFMWCMTLIFSREYFAHYHNRNRYYFFNLMTLGATMGVFLSADLYTTLVFFEIMSFTSYTWVIHEEDEAATRAANTYLAVAVIGGLAALMGLFLLWNKLGTLKISELYDAACACSDKTGLYVAGCCILFGFGAKAGMYPLHIWLPKAHPVAPAPASALLSGVLTKSGIFGILVLSCNIFRYDKNWGVLILTLGVITMFLGAVIALLSINLKRILACSSMSQIGFIMVGIGMMGLLGEENALAARGALLHMMNHSLFKLLLFMVAGTVYMNLHKLDLNDIRGFGRKKTLLKLLYLMGALGIGGIPGWSGYISKTLLHESILEYGGPWIMKAVEWIFLISGGLTLAYMTKLYVAIFVERHGGVTGKSQSARQMKLQDEIQDKYDAMTRYMNPASSFAMIVPAVMIPILGMLPYATMDKLADIGTDFFRTTLPEHAVHYFNLENLKGAAISVAIGAAVYFLIVRKLLMKTEDGQKVYINVIPAWLDLEELIYRPLLLKILPGIFGWILSIPGENKILTPVCKAVMNFASKVARVFGENLILTPVCKGVMTAATYVATAFAESIDALILLLSKSVYRELVPHEYNKYSKTIAYQLGHVMDEVEEIEEKLHHKKHKEKESHAEHFVNIEETLKKTSRVIRGNLSFALLMLLIVLCIALYYMLLH